MQLSGYVLFVCNYVYMYVCTYVCVCTHICSEDFYGFFTLESAVRLHAKTPYFRCWCLHKGICMYVCTYVSMYAFVYLYLCVMCTIPTTTQELSTPNFSQHISHVHTLYHTLFQYTSFSIHLFQYHPRATFHSTFPMFTLFFNTPASCQKTGTHTYIHTYLGHIFQVRTTNSHVLTARKLNFNVRITARKLNVCNRTHTLSQRKPQQRPRLP